jgi:uncharacterized protein (TIGR02996 family)
MPTPHDKAFLADILAHPEDDTPRLIYADWLTDHGQTERGEFIRIQIERSHLDEDDPAQDELERREQQLLGRNPAWRLEVPRWGRINQVFRRGFLTEVQAKWADFKRGATGLWRKFPVRSVRLLGAMSGLEELVDLAESSPLRELELIGTPPPEAITRLADSSLFSRLDRFHLGGGRFRAVRGDSLLARPENFAGLRVLDLAGNDFNEVNVRDLANIPMPELRTLRLECASFVARHLTPILSPARRPVLTDLDVSGTGLDSAPVAELTAHAGRLTRLHVRHNQLHAADLATLLGGVGDLRHFSVDNNPLGAGGVGLLATSPRLAGLTRLSLAGVGLEGPALLALIRSSRLQNLRRLDLTAYGLKNAGAGVLADGLDLPALTWLDLRSNELSDTGIERLASSARLGRLVGLELNGNMPGLRGIKALAASPHLTRLGSLGLAWCGLGDDAAIALAASPNLGGLWRLDLANNSIREAGLAALIASSHLTGLSELWVDHRMLAPGIATALQERFGPALRP